jgi:hypothetical protein
MKPKSRGKVLQIFLIRSPLQLLTYYNAYVRVEHYSYASDNKIENTTNESTALNWFIRKICCS